MGSVKISVVIPAYNSVATIKATLDSVLAQTVAPDEILVLDDGSTDGTLVVLESYQSRITLLRQENRGVANARNVLYARAKGDLIAFLDHDDLWHPDYLQTQKKLFTEHPNAVAFFAGHTTIYGNGDSKPWEVAPVNVAKTEVIPPVEFIRQYHQGIGIFMSMSFCCVPKAALQKLGERPFCEQVSGVDDCHLFHQLPLHGSVVYHPALLAAYRITQAGQSADRLKNMRLSVLALELLWAQYRRLKDASLRSIFSWAFAMRRREYGKVLMSAGKTGEARRQFLLAMGNCLRPVSMAKSVRLLFFSCLPRSFQPRWLPIRTAAQGPDLV
jgi:glycosyltransferase involved in cell wall biosynthesis